MLYKKLLIFIISVFAFFSCKEPVEKGCFIGKKDKDYDFFSSIYRTIDFDYIHLIDEIGMYGINRDNFGWVKNPENLKSTYRAIKSIGLEKFISENEFNQVLFDKKMAHPSIQNKSLNKLIKLLLDSYNGKKNDEYFTKFWLRRRKEKNEKIVYQILEDIYCFYTSKECDSIINTNWKPNSLIENMLSFDYELYQLDETRDFENVKYYFNYLEKLDLPISAHNLIIFTMRNYELDDLTKKELLILKNKNNIKKVKCHDYEQWRLDAKWFAPVYDEGP